MLRTEKKGKRGAYTADSLRLTDEKRHQIKVMRTQICGVEKTRGVGQTHLVV